MDIGSKRSYPSGNLSNFQPHTFEIYIDELPDEIRLNINDSILKTIPIDNAERHFIKCHSMEGFLQGMKRNKAHIQIDICKDIGIKAKRRGSKGNKAWKSKQTLWFLEIPMTRKGDLYQKVLDVGFKSLFRNTKFRKALSATLNATLTHSMGRSKESETVLTIREFCGRLTKLRDIRLL